jgi:acyl carrier protein
MTRAAEVRDAVRLSILQVLGSLSPEAVHGAAQLVDDLGANSIDQADIIETAMERLSLDIAMSHFARVKSVQDLEDVLGGQGPSTP